jgi:glycosyltransferase involved in cell wall biosynthesis
MANLPAPEVSVIIPAYNTAALIPQCLNSVFAQTYTDFEAIVVNDGSPDTPQLEKALDPYQDRIVYISQKNKRAAGARNTAIRQARGKFLAFLDSDDAWLPQHLASQMKMFQQQPALDLVYADTLVVGDPNHTWKFMDRCPSQGEASFCALVVERCQIPISTVVVRRDAIVKAGLFDENLSCFDDYDMWLRTAFHGGKIGYTREAQARSSGKRPGSLGDSIHRIVAAYWSILEKALRTMPLSQAERNVITNRLAESKALFQMEEAKRHLQSRQFSKAKELFREANRHFHRPELNLTVFALGIAPSATRKVIETWGRIRSGQSA